MRPLSLLVALSGLLLNSCFSAGDGQAPPLNKLYFPTGLVLDARSVDAMGVPIGAAKYLYVASSDFDLQYRASSLASFDLARVAAVVPQSCATGADCESGECDNAVSEANHGVPSYFCLPSPGASPCGALLERSEADRLLNPGRCQSINPIAPQDGLGSLVHDAVGIGAFATDVVLSVNPDDSTQARLFLPVRGDATLHWIDLVDGKFECGQSETDDHSCNEAHRSGLSTSDNIDELRQPAEPFAIAVNGDADFVTVTNQTAGSVSLFHNSWATNVGPALVDILTGLPQAPVAITALPKPAAGLYAAGVSPAPGFLVAYRNAAEVDLLRVRVDPAVSGTGSASYSRYALQRAGTASINANSLGFDSRGIVIDSDQRSLDYAKCAVGDRACLLRAHQPDVYVSNRAPSSLLVGAMTADYAYTAGTSELPSFTDSVPLTSGPSRVVLGKVRVAAPGSVPVYEQRVFIVCFDSRRIFVYDPKRRVIEAIISTGRGPYALAIDEGRSLAYVAHFTDSYLGVISLDQRFPQNYATIVASIGTPSPPRSSK